MLPSRKIRLELTRFVLCSSENHKLQDCEATLCKVFPKDFHRHNSFPSFCIHNELEDLRKVPPHKHRGISSPHPSVLLKDSRGSEAHKQAKTQKRYFMRINKDFFLF